MKQKVSDVENKPLRSTLRTILDAVESEEYQTALELFESIDNVVEDEDIELRECLRRGKHVCLLYLSKCDIVVDDSKSDDLSRAYAYYKLENYHKSLEILIQSKNEASTASKALEAQCRFHLNDPQAAYAFAQLESDTSDGASLTNAVASLIAHATFFCRQEIDPNIEKCVEDYVKLKDDCPYELLFNWGTLKLLTTPDSAARIGFQKLLDSAASTAEKKGERLETAKILMNQEILRDLWRASTATISKTQVNWKEEELPESTRILHNIHCAMAQENSRQALQLFEKDPSSKLLPFQQHLWYYNRAIYQLWTAQYEKCRSTCEFLLACLGLSNFGKQPKKERKQSSSVSSSILPEHQLWWQVRVTVLLAHCSIREQAVEKNGALVTKIEGLQKMVQEQLQRDSSLRVQLESYLAAHKAAIVRKNDNVSTVVEELPDNVTELPVFEAVKQKMCHGSGETQSTSNARPAKADVVLADFYYSQGEFELAAGLFEDKFIEMGDDVVARARWVRALSYIDPMKAIEKWHLPELATAKPNDEHHLAIGNELEAQELLPWWLLQGRKGHGIELFEEKKRRKSRGAVVLSRIRKREAFLASLGAQSKASSPDPERWLPKRERATSRRRHGQMPKSSQGGISEKDVAKLDVLARQAARAAGVTHGPSTAHLTVTAAPISGKGKTGKRR